MLIVNYLLCVKEFKVAGNSLQDFPRLDSNLYQLMLQS